jgi:uncharacterized damage-inducible protein DinB
MPIAQTMLPECDHEMAVTRRMLAAVPEADADWRPHPKSTALGDLAVHIARLVSWGRSIFEVTELDLGAPPAGAPTKPPFTTTAQLLETFDRNVAAARAALAAAPDQDMGVVWTLRNGPATVFALPRAAVLRGFLLNHIIHHRGQLSVYLRLRDVPLPSVYGPTADMGR